MRTVPLLFIISYLLVSCQKEVDFEKKKLVVEKMTLNLNGSEVGSGEWIIKDGTSFQGVSSSDAFIGDGYIQFRIISSGPKSGFFNSALEYSTNKDWALQHDPFNNKLIFMELRQNVDELQDYSFADDYFRWYRTDSTITLRHCGKENGSYQTIYTSKMKSDPQQPLYFGSGTSGVGNGIVEVKIAGYQLIKL